MKESTQSHRRVGVWSAVTMVMTGVAYIIVGAVGVMARSPSPDPLHQDDPYLAILEFLIVLSAVALVSMMAAVYGYSPPSTKTYSLVSLAFMVVLAVLTSSVHFASLTVGRQIESGAMPQLYRQLSFEQWPSVALALDFLAWDFFLGLSLLSAAAVFKGDRLHTTIRITMIVAGSLCIAGTLGRLLGQLRIALLATVGYAFVLPVICVLLAVLYLSSHFAMKIVNGSRGLRQKASVSAHLSGDLTNQPYGNGLASRTAFFYFDLGRQNSF